MFGCVCYIFNNKEHLGKFDPKADEGIFVGYSLVSKAFRVYNGRLKVIENIINVKFDEVSIVHLTTLHISNALRPKESSTLQHSEVLKPKKKTALHDLQALELKWEGYSDDEDLLVEEQVESPAVAESILVVDDILTVRN